MNLKTLRFTIICSITLLTKEILCGPSKKFPVPDTNPMNSRFADLLNSLVKVNVERVDTLKKLFKLYDVNGAKQLLRTSQGRKPGAAVLLDNQDEYSEIDNKFGDFENDEKSHVEDRAVGLEDVFSDINVRFHNDERSNEADEPIIFYIYPKPSKQGIVSTFSNSGSTQNVLSAALKSGKHIKPKSSICISPRRGYKDCKTACKQAYGFACSGDYCSERLYKHLRRECRHACRRKFKKPYDYDDYDYE